MDKLDLSPVSSAIGLSIVNYYQWVNNSAFYAMADPYIYPFYNQWTRQYDYWLNGLVPQFHDVSAGLIPTNLARMLVDKVSALMLGGGLLFEQAKQVTKEDKYNEALGFINKWAKDTNFLSLVLMALKQTIGLGTCALKLNCDKDMKLWTEAVPMNRGYFDIDAQGNITRARCWITTYTKSVGNNRSGVQYGLLEERYYNDKTKEPCVVYRLYQLPEKVNNFAPTNAINMNWEQLEKWVRESIERDFDKIKIGVEQKLPFADLGMYAMRWTPCVSVMPQLKYGDSILANILNYLAQYDYLNAIMVTEMYSGRSRVLLPRGMNSKKNANYNEGLDSFIYQFYESLNTDGQKPEFIQADIRAEQLKTIRNTILENISTAIGLSPSSFASYLQDNSNRTAREVSAEESSTTLFIDNKRILVIETLNKLLKTVLRFNGYVDDVEVKFSRAGQTNYTLLVENVTKLYSAGLVSLEQAVADLNPTKDQEQINKEIERIKDAQAQQQNSLFGNMDFGENINDEQEV